MSSAEGPYAEIMERIDKEELAELALEMGNILSPAGFEGAAGEYVADWFRSHGFETVKQEVVPGRYNVIGALRGQGRGRSLIYNAHLDTAYGAPEDVWALGEVKPFYTKAWREGDTLFGHGLVNAKGCIAAFMIAGKAIKESGISLKGDLLLAPTAGEIGQAPVDEFQGPRYLGKGLGVEYLVTHGFLADYSLICETTNFMIGWAQPGDAFFKVTVDGRNIYTPYINRPYKLEENPNAIVKMAQVILALEEWALSYQESNRYEYAGGSMIPKVAIGAVRGGTPWRPLHTSALCSLYIDVRVPPNRPILDVQREIEEVTAATGIKARVEAYLSKRGFEAEGAEGLVEAVRVAHARVFGRQPEKADWSISSMWRDMNIFNAHGIPSATYGPGLGAGGGNLALTVDELADAAKVYALVALDICNRPR
ncbi:MAG TPA: M20/M25/M40 family metallo-hydrolase [Dehalococcoidia bacterium]|nr:M20/M25/M40 family metallo-hydrolase [Dehalococcoidia bacterium]